MWYIQVGDGGSTEKFPVSCSTETCRRYHSRKLRYEGIAAPSRIDKGECRVERKEIWAPVEKDTRVKIGVARVWGVDERVSGVRGQSGEGYSCQTVDGSARVNQTRANDPNRR